MPQYRTKGNSKHEDKASSLLRKALEKKSCVVEKTHGNQYSDGKADFLITRPDGTVLRQENKFTSNKTLCALQAIALLRPSQKGNLFWLRKKTKANILICTSKLIEGVYCYSFCELPPIDQESPLEFMPLEKATEFVMNYNYKK